MGHSVKEAARHIGVHLSTMRRYIREGCPTLSLGSVGRGHGTRVDLKAVAQWLLEKKVPTLAKRSNNEMLSILDTALDDWLKRDGWAGQTISPERAVLLIYRRVYINLTHQPFDELKDLPPALERVRAILLESLERPGSLSMRR